MRRLQRFVAVVVMPLAVMVILLAPVGAAAAGGPRPPAAPSGGVVTNCTEAGLEAALAAGGGITFNCGGPATIVFTSPLVMSESATVNGGDTIELSGQGIMRLFVVPSGTTLRLEHIVLDGGNSGASDGGAISSAGVLILDSSIIQYSRTDDNHSGGAIFSSGPVTITNSTLKNNKGGSGAGIYNDRGTATLTNVTLSGNSAISYGGGIDNFGGTATLTNATLSGNSATEGGGIYNVGGTATLTNATLSGNSASEGGGISNFQGTATLTNATLSGNSADAGGGIGTIGGTATLTNVTMSGNSAEYNGGGIWDYEGTATLMNATLSGNSANEGGGIHNYRGTATLTNVTLSGNSAGYGGGIWEYGSSAAEYALLKNTIIAFGAAGANCYRDTTSVGTIISNGYNLSSDGTCATYFNQPGDLANENPNLGTLANNGGPTLTQLPNLPSKALDAIPNGANGCGTTLTSDQRGVARPYHNRCDIGAVEATWPYPHLWLALVRR